MQEGADVPAIDEDGPVRSQRLGAGSVPAGPDEGLTLEDLVAQLGGELVGDPGAHAIRVQRVATLGSATAGDISFCHRGKYADQLRATRASAVVIAPADRGLAPCASILTANPYLYFARVAALLNPEPKAVAGVHPTSVIGSGAEVHPTASIGPHCVIGAGARIAAEVAIDAGCVIGDGASVGAGSRLHARVTIYARCLVGERCLLLSGAVIGADGFGLAPDQGRWVRIPQVGRVVIGNDVEVGANTTIDRGALDDTVIEDGVKLDNQIQIGHNCRIGAHTAIAGCVGIAGSTRIGQHCMIGGAAMIAGHLELCDRVVVSGGTLVSRSIREPGTYTGVYPFEPNRRWTRNAATLRHLDEMATRLRTLERRLGAAPDASAAVPDAAVPSDDPDGR